MLPETLMHTFCRTGLNEETLQRAQEAIGCAGEWYLTELTHLKAGSLRKHAPESYHAALVVNH